MLPAFATTDQLAARVPGGIPPGDLARAAAVLDDASSKIRAETSTTFVDSTNALVANLPDIIVTVTLAAALRAFSNPENLSQEGVGPYHAAWANASPDVYITKQERILLRRAAGHRGLWAQGTTRNAPNEFGIETSTYPGDDIFIPTTLASAPDAPTDPIEWAGPDGF